MLFAVRLSKFMPFYQVIAMHRSTMWGIVKWILVALAGLGLALFAVLKVIATR